MHASRSEHKVPLGYDEGCVRVETGKFLYSDIARVHNTLRTQPVDNCQQAADTERGRARKNQGCQVLEHALPRWRRYISLKKFNEEGII